jgi:diguanylate cyclase (GGDEF)-like protein/PAS domain S-box-containing protein
MEKKLKSGNFSKVNKFKIIKRELLSEEIFYSLTNIVKDAIISADSFRKIVYWNRAAEKIFSYTSSEILGKSIGLVIPQDNLSFSGLNGRVKDKNNNIGKNQSQNKNKEKFIEIIGRRKDGSKIPLEISVTSWESDKGLFFTLIIRDITIRKNTEEKLRYLSFHDNLTSLYNRSYFDEELQRLDTTRQLPLSIIIGDIDGFKLVNDAFGYKEGDDLLKSLAKVLKESCRSDDILARWGGDEFVILLPKTDSRVTAEIISRIEKKSKSIGSNEIPLNISLGFSIKDRPAQNIESIIKEAENSMKQTKLLQSKKVSSAIIASIEKKLQEKSYQSHDVVERVKNLAVLLGKAIKLPKIEMDNLALLVSFHDIGKVAIKESILAKKTKLADKEWEVMKMHPEIGYRIAKTSTQLVQIADAILAHHENWDGSGYPYHVKGIKIPIISRIIAIAKAYDVMTYGRNYKKAISKEEAVRELKGCSKKQFDPQLVSKFIEVIEDREENLSLFQ